MNDIPWKLFEGASVQHLYGTVYILHHETRTDGFPKVVVQSGDGGAMSPDANSLTPAELHAIANWKQSRQQS